MTDRSTDVPMSTAEKMESARNVLALELTSLMLKHSLPSGGEGTISIDKNGVEHIAGLNNDNSTINWTETPSRTNDGNETIDKNTFTANNASVMHKQTLMYHELDLLNGNGSTDLQLIGTCKDNDISTECNYNFSSASKRGTVHTWTSELAHNNSTSPMQSDLTLIDIQSETGYIWQHPDVDGKAKLSFHIVDDTATYKFTAESMNDYMTPPKKLPEDLLDKAQR